VGGHRSADVGELFVEDGLTGVEVLEDGFATDVEEDCEL